MEGDVFMYSKQNVEIVTVGEVCAK